MDKDVRYTCDAKLESKRPYLNKNHAITLAKNLFHLNNVDRDSSIKELDSYDDRNFYMKGKLGKSQKVPEEFVFKVLNFAYSENVVLVDGYTAVMLFLKKEGFQCPCPLKTAVNGRHYVMCKFPWKSSSFDMNGKSQCQSRHENNTQDLTDGIIIYSGEEYDRERECVCAVWLLEFIQGKGLHEIPCSSQVLNQCGAYLAKLHVSLKVSIQADDYHST